MTAGRPSTYDPSHCERVIELGKRGKSVAVMAAQLDVHKDTIYEWMRVHPEFSDAIKRALTYSQEWWEDAGQNALQQTNFQGSMWSRSMAARFPADWRESTKTELSGTVQVGRIERTLVKPEAK